MLIGPCHASGEMIQGMVFTMTPNNQHLSIESRNSLVGEMEYIDINLAPHTQYEGVLSSNEIEVGDWVTAEVFRNQNSGRLEASRLMVERPNQKENQHDAEALKPIGIQKIEPVFKEDDSYIPQIKLHF